jgi:hypothetical protein
MLVAVDSENRKLIIGLHAENVRRLLNDMPIERRLSDTPGIVENVPDLAGWTLYVLGPEDLERFVAAVSR